MDLAALDAAIGTLENGETTLKNVQELASLYIVRDGLAKAKFGGNTREKREVLDILPSYEAYAEAKTTFQRDKIGEDVLLKRMRNLCAEVREFVEILYAGTDLARERKEIRNMVQNIKLP